MGGLIQNATRILHGAETRVDVAGQNIANLTTSGYKRRVSFSEALSGTSTMDAPYAKDATVTDFSQGKLVNTGNASDLALSGGGFFVVRAENRLLYVRQGQFSVDPEGHLVTPDGYVLQDEGGGDLVVGNAGFQVLADGAVIAGGEPQGKVAIIDADSPGALQLAAGGAFSADPGALRTAEDATVRQGFIEASNVSTGDEMVTIMQALRSAETAQRLVSVYDDLMGRALSTFGQS